MVADGLGAEGDEFAASSILDHSLDVFLFERSRMLGPDEHHGIQPILIPDFLFDCIRQDSLGDFLVAHTLFAGALGNFQHLNSFIF